MEGENDDEKNGRPIPKTKIIKHDFESEKEKRGQKISVNLRA